jgi:uncharacterized membrane protein
MSATSTEVPPPAGESVEDLRLVTPGRGLSAGAGWDWIAQGWKLFARSPLMWIVAIVILVIVAVLMSFVPILGSLAFQLLTPVFSAGLIVACRSLERGGEFELEHIFAGFRTRFGSLLVVGLLYLVGGLILLLVLAAFAGFSILTAILSGQAAEVMTAMAASAMAIVLGVLVALALGLLLVAAYWFAPALVVMHDVKPLEAMKLSFFACFRNFIPFLVYGLVMMILAIIAVIPFGLGMLVWIPVAVASTYVAYRQIFTED